MNKLEEENVRFGADPEFFFEDKDGNIVESLKVLGKREVEHIYRFGIKVITDGVQGELNFSEDHVQECRQLFASRINRCLSVAANIAHEKGYKISNKTTVKIPLERLDKMSPDARTFGCAPSKNIYDSERPAEKVDAGEYPYRSAGGHLHLGIPRRKLPVSKIKTLVKALDYLVGNTMVLFDGDNLGKERRKTYGRAGEYRVKKYGLEYRTLSNAWCKNYVLLSLITRLSRIAYSFVYYKKVRSVFSRVPVADIVRAINENDKELALKNLKKIVPVLSKNFDSLNAEVIPYLAEKNHKLLNDQDFYSNLIYRDSYYEERTGTSMEGWERRSAKVINSTGFQKWRSRQ